MALWSQRSPGFAARKQELQQTFAANERMEVNGLAVGKVTVEGDRATVRVSVEMRAIEMKTGKAVGGLGKRERTLHCVKETGEWKVWGEASSVEELAAAAAAAKTEEEGKGLLARESGLMTADLVQALLREGDRRRDAGDSQQALMVYRLSLLVAERIGDKQGNARALFKIALSLDNLGRYPEALTYYQKALEQYEALGDRLAAAHQHLNIGTVQHEQGDYAHALEHFQKALTQFEALGDKHGIATVSGWPKETGMTRATLRTRWSISRRRSHNSRRWAKNGWLPTHSIASGFSTWNKATIPRH
jgi:tetratricopeptide (TPR) repeat protein